jgi:hypothetical protein
MDLAILPDGSVYQLGDDGLWHHIPDVATANAIGIEWNNLPGYDQLPGPVGDELPSVTAGTPTPPSPPPPSATPADTQPAPATSSVSPGGPSGPLALLPDGSVYMLGSDGLWHHIPDVATANAIGIDWNNIPSYDTVPGPVGDELPSVVVAAPTLPSPPPTNANQAGQQPTPAAGTPTGQLALLPDGSVYMLGSDGLWHHIPDVATANAIGIDWNNLPSYDTLPGPTGDELPSVVGPSSTPTAPPPSTGVNRVQPATGETIPGDWTTADLLAVQPTAAGTPIPNAKDAMAPPSVSTGIAPSSNATPSPDVSFGPNRPSFGGDYPPNVTNLFASGVQTRGPTGKSIATVVTVTEKLTLDGLYELVSPSAILIDQVSGQILDKLLEKFIPDKLLTASDFLGDATTAAVIAEAEKFLNGPLGWINQWFLASGLPAYLAVQYTLQPAVGNNPIGVFLEQRYYVAPVDAYLYYLPAQVPGSLG